MKNIPDEKQLEQLLETVPPDPGTRIAARLAAAPWTHRAVARRRTSVVISLAVLALAALVAATPQGRAFANNVLHFFTRAGSDTLPYTPQPVAWVESTPGVPAPTMTPLAPMAPFAADCGDYQSPTCSIEQIRGKVDFTISELGTIPARFYFIGATGGPDSVYIDYDAEDNSGGLVIFESPWTGSPEQTAWQVGVSAVVETVQIGSVTGEYVKGIFILIDGEASVNWDPNLDIQTLHWVDNDVFFEMQVTGSAAQISRDAFIALAENLTTEPISANLPPMPATDTPEAFDFSLIYPLTIAQAEEQAGFDVLEPSRMPAVLLPLVGASYEPEDHIVWIFYPVDPGWVGPGMSDGLRLLEQLAPNPDDCALCGFQVVNGDALWADDPGSMVGGGIQMVMIGDVPGQYVEGVWTGKNNDGSWAWEPTPYVKRLRWQANGTAFELIFYGMEIEPADLVAIAESMK